MFDQLKQLADLKKMRDQALRLKKELSQERVTIEEGEIKIIVRGDQKIEMILIDGQDNKPLVMALNKALEEAQKRAARKMAGLSGVLGGLLG